MEENGESMWRMTRSRMSRRLTSTPNSTTTSYSFSYVARESKTVSPLEWFTSHSRHVSVDERDGIQKKTFTKWVNKHLAKAGCKVDDLFVDLRDGFSLITLLEVLTGERLPRENGYTRFHRIQNVQYCLDFLKKKSIKLVNIRPEDIVEGNGKLTLGLIWTIILNFQVSVIKRRQLEEQLSAQNYNSTTQARISVAFAYSTLLAKIAPKNIALPIHAAALPNLFCEIAKRAVD
ncbi:hypothetical protein Y032_0289g1498 [Ancylostoma ceylanicum]|uniref:Calponin-homology (CH) domain-containing protein n=1 Tax=Ancylostoma ceylanicum TaxID=53326 RepID=A0A016S5B1_9BILA|nr:hypothetical protein Y032_0289g1498 [Ancylostoma ceylanicum]